MADRGSLRLLASVNSEYPEKLDLKCMRCLVSQRVGKEGMSRDSMQGMVVQRSKPLDTTQTLHRKYLPSSSETSSKEVTEILCEARLGDLGASPSVVSACARVASGFGSSASVAGSFSSSFFSSAPSRTGMSGTSGTCESATGSAGAAEEDESRLLSSDREREVDVGRGVVSVASSKASCKPGS